MIDESKQKTNNDISNMAYFIEDLLETVRSSEIYLSKYTLKNILNASISKLEIPSTVDLRFQGNDVAILCDDRKLQVVFGNLLKYAIEAIKGQGYVSVKILNNANSVEINFEDSGEGIGSVEQNRMFEPMFSTIKNGSGLGLAISKMIVEQHGGRLVYKNNPSVFSVILPKSNSI